MFENIDGPKNLRPSIRPDAPKGPMTPENTKVSDRFPKELNLQSASEKAYLRQMSQAEGDKNDIELSPFEQELYEELKGLPMSKEPITFDSDETVIHSTIKGLNVEKARANGYDIHKVINSEGKEIEFIINPVIESVIRVLHKLGNPVTIESNNVRETYLHPIFSSIDSLKPCLDYIKGYEDHITPENYDSSKYPDHPSNMGFFNKITDAGYRYTVGVAKNYIWGGVKYMAGMSDVAPYVPKLTKKYTWMQASGVIVDNSKSKNLYRTDYVTFNPGEFDGMDPKPDQAETKRLARELLHNIYYVTDRKTGERRPAKYAEELYYQFHGRMPSHGGPDNRPPLSERAEKFMKDKVPKFDESTLAEARQLVAASAA